ncbi:Sporulation kinase D [Caulifigura coniformis]|uniref:histidine kinase n=1 Tax=Caulifigura coniformis TaxID=2527983 RepID=A0A517SHD8_9PLAN|nr:ATP-binding protein [Caulifigura coniformis]QDT55541.1 Sporulation kinase D [Caulifigura coniformis]
MIREFEDELQRAKLEALAEFAAGAGHEINNPLATILGRTELLLRRIGRVVPTGEAAEATRDLNVIAGQVQRIREMIGDLMLFARPPVPRLAPCELNAVVESTIAAVHATARSHQVEIQTRLTRNRPVLADHAQLSVVVSELLRNAVQAVPSGGRVEVSTSNLVGDGASPVRLTISDNGPGLSEADLQHLFDPFYSGRQAGRGLGFGLCKCWRIAQSHGASLRVAVRPEGGVEATVDWPSA